jgi:hypothetical protein
MPHIMPQREKAPTGQFSKIFESSPACNNNNKQQCAMLIPRNVMLH